LKYWKLEPYVGFGADAHSFDGRVRRQNPESVEEYLNRPRVECTLAHCDEERFFVGLRLMAGIRPAPEEWRRFEEPIRRFLDAGLLETDAAFSASPAAACCFPTKFSRSLSPHDRLAKRYRH